MATHCWCGQCSSGESRHELEKTMKHNPNVRVRSFTDGFHPLQIEAAALVTNTHDDNIECMATTGLGDRGLPEEYIFTGCRDGTVGVWDVRMLNKKVSAREGADPVKMKNFLTADQLKDGAEKKFIGSSWQQLPGHWGWVTGLAYGKTKLPGSGEGGGVTHSQATPGSGEGGSVTHSQAAPGSGEGGGVTHSQAAPGSGEGGGVTHSQVRQRQVSPSMIVSRSARCRRR